MQSNLLNVIDKITNCAFVLFFENRMVYGGRGGNDAHSAFSVSRSTSTTKMPDMSKLQLDRYDILSCGLWISGTQYPIWGFFEAKPFPKFYNFFEKTKFLS